MKGIALTTIFLIGLMLVGGIAVVGSGYINPKVEYNQFTQPLQFKSESNDYEVPKEAYLNADASVSEVGSDFKIECDRTLYSGFSTIEVVCDISNVRDEFNIDKDIGFIFEPSSAKVSKSYVWNPTAVASSNTYCERWSEKETCEEDIKNMTTVCTTDRTCDKYKTDYTYGAWESTSIKSNTFESRETRKYKFIIEVQRN